VERRASEGKVEAKRLNQKTTKQKSENAENLSHLTTAPCEGMSGFCLRMVLKMRVVFWQGNESNEKQKKERERVWD